MHIGLDLDGTLISCKEKHIHLMATLAKSYNINFDSEKYWSLKRSGYNNYSALTVLGVEKEKAKALHQQWCCNIENIEWAFFDKLHPDAEIFLNKLKKLGCFLHLISARHNEKNAWQQIRNLNLKHYFDSVDFVNIQRGEEKFTFLKERKVMVYVGDTEYDKKSADLANIESYLVSNGMRNRIFLSQYTNGIFNNLTQVYEGIIYV